jgi:hypothetical protein
MLVYTLLHGALFFSKQMYDNCMSVEDKAAFARLIHADHVAITAAMNFGTFIWELAL